MRQRPLSQSIQSSPHTSLKLTSQPSDDSNPKKWGTLWNDISVISFDELVKKRSEFHKIIIASPYFREMEQTLFDLGMKSDIDFITIQSFPND